MSKTFEPIAAKFALDPGERVKPVYQWNEEKTDLLKVGEVDVTKEMNERAVGTTIYELLAKFGGLDGVAANFPDDGEGDQDLTIFPETSGEMTEMAAAADRVAAAEKVQKSGQKTAEEEIAELKARIAELEKPSAEGEQQ